MEAKRLLILMLVLLPVLLLTLFLECELSTKQHLR